MANKKKAQASLDDTKKKQMKTASKKETKSTKTKSNEVVETNKESKKSTSKKTTATKTTTKAEAKKKTTAELEKKNSEKVVSKKNEAKKEITKKGNQAKENKKKEEAEVEVSQVEHEKEENLVAEADIKKGLSEESKKNQKEKEKQHKEKQQISASGKTVISTPPMSSDEMTRLVKIILVLVVIVVAFYGLTVLITKWRKNTAADRDTTVTPAVIQYDEILIGTLLNQSRNEYYVLIQADDDPYQALTSYYTSSYAQTTGALKVYTANLNSGLNSYYVAETSNIRPEHIKDFRVSDVTLIYVKDHKIVEAYEGIEGVSAALKVLVNSNKILNLN